MKVVRKMVILLAVLLVFGGARLHFERKMMEDFRQAGLMRAKMDIGTRDKIDQTSSAVALGGLRTLVATFLHLRAHVCFEDRRWDDLEDTYGTIVDLAPHTRYYWETGSWHLAYNAASYFLHESSMPTLRRREQWRSFVHRGRDFLERGIRNNPEDWRLHANLAHMLRDPNKYLAFRDREACLLAAADAYGKAAELGSYSPLLMERFRFYCLVRVSGREEESLQLARSLYSDPRHRRPTLKMLLYVLECHAKPERDVEALALEIFGDAKKAYESLARHWQRNREGYPSHGVAEGVVHLERLLGIPTPQSILAQPPSPSLSLDDWFKKSP